MMGFEPTTFCIGQEALGQSAGIHRTEISLLERAEREPRLGMILRLARAMTAPLSVLLDGIV